MSSADVRALCVVCGAPAIGRNFDAYTCLSCKAFFRRNGYNEHLRNTCRVLGSCEITVMTRRHCAACRLKKCFEQGMKKELIRSLIAINHSTCVSNINRLAQKSTVSRTTTVSLAVVDTRLSLSADDWSRLTHIRNAYEEHCVQPFLLSHQTIPLILTAQPYRARFKLQRLIDLKQKYTNVVASFIRRILQYDPLQEANYEDIKENFKLLLTLNSTELMKSAGLDHVPWENDRLLFESILTESLMHRLESNLHRYQTMSPYDPVMMKLFLIILSLTTGISPLMKKTHYDTRDFQAKPNSIHLSQNYYLTLLWKYVTYRLDQREAVNYSVRFIQNFLHRQSLEVEMMDVVQSRNDHGQFAESLQAATNL